MSAEIDHLVVVAATLDQGAAWCERVLGVAPEAGGRHALMGTHNRLLAIGSDAFPKAYLEIIAIDPDAPPPGRSRWFGMDRPAVQAAVRAEPQLLHLVCRTTNIEMQRWGLVNLGLQPGQLLSLERATPDGQLRWRLLVREDGAAECAGRLPTLIEWPDRHPADRLPPSPVRLREVRLGGLPERVARLLALRGVALQGEDVVVTLETPRGQVTLEARSERLCPCP